MKQGYKILQYDVLEKDCCSGIKLSDPHAAKSEKPFRNISPAHKI
jgi:hypothetical protein